MTQLDTDEESTSCLSFYSRYQPISILCLYLLYCSSIKLVLIDPFLSCSSEGFPLTWRIENINVITGECGRTSQIRMNSMEHILWDSLDRGISNS